MEAEATNQNQSQSAGSATQPIESQKAPSPLSKILPFVAFALIIAAGITTGLILSSANKSGSASPSVVSEEDLSPELKKDLAQTFSDEAEGVLEKNDDLDKYAQGSHKLIRPGGEDQTAYLTSSVLDLNEYESQKIKVFGETFGSSQVGWLMDVGKVEVIE